MTVEEIQQLIAAISADVGLQNELKAAPNEAARTAILVQRGLLKPGQQPPTRAEAKNALEAPRPAGRVGALNVPEWIAAAGAVALLF